MAINTLRDGLLPVIDALRQLPNTFGLRRYTVVLRTRTWSGVYPGEGTSTNVDTPINPPPKVRFLSAAEIASSGGTYRDGDVLLEKITPAYVNVTPAGFSPAVLDPNVTAKNVDVAVILTGDEGVAEAELIKTLYDRAFNYSMVVRLVRGSVRG